VEAVAVLVLLEQQVLEQVEDVEVQEKFQQ
jgi:hypothetical protein